MCLIKYGEDIDALKLTNKSRRAVIYCLEEGGRGQWILVGYR